MFSRPGSCFFEKFDKIFFGDRKRRLLLCVANLHQANRFGTKLFLVLAKDLPNAAFPDVTPHRGRIRFTAHHDSDHGFFFRSYPFFVVSPANPQIKKLSSSKLSSLDEMFEGCLSADPLIRSEPLYGPQNLYLG